MDEVKGEKKNFLQDLREKNANAVQFHAQDHSSRDLLALITVGSLPAFWLKELQPRGCENDFLPESSPLVPVARESQQARFIRALP